MQPCRVLVVFGTRPEAIKLCALVRHLSSLSEQFTVQTCVTAQHREMLDQVLDAFSVEPEFDLDLMRPRQSLSDVTWRVLKGLEPVIAESKPDVVIVQGDTTTTFAAALAAFYQKIPVAHVEAGLRTGNRYSPFPEEMNRRLGTHLSTLHFAATDEGATNLTREGVDPTAIYVTGNTVIDALLYMVSALRAGQITPPRWDGIDPSKKLILVTAHRRENHGDPIRRIADALVRLAARDDVQIVFPVHRNPQVAEPVRERLADLPNVLLLAPQQYTPFVDLLDRCHFVLTDSGGVQEEAPALGKPVLVMRENTERPEAVSAGTAKLVGTGTEAIVSAAEELLDDRSAYQRMARAHNPYGDGAANRRIAEALIQWHESRQPETAQANHA